MSVAGVSAPAFVERGFQMDANHEWTESVAGVSAPAFVERSSTGCEAEATVGLSRSVAGVSAPAFVERDASLSAQRHRQLGVAGVSAPAFVERWEVLGTRWETCLGRVAGVSAPAFVERRSRSIPSPLISCVAGVSAPAFVERGWPSRRRCRSCGCRRGKCPGLR